MSASMKPGTFLLAFTLFCTLLGLGCPLSCEVCRGSGPTCSGKMKTCEAGKDACVVIVGESCTKGRHSVNTYKACMKFSDCYSGFVSTTMGPKDYMVSNTRCCQSDGCNHGSVPPPPNNRTENGLQCPACIAPFQETCPGTQAARCVGQETHCVYFAGKVQAGLITPKFATRGCATESACFAKAGAQVPSASYLYFLRRADCLPASQPPGRAE
ncbi:phospholipase A2 inhibitor and Ly6/PLAUR domain-containing protein [Hyaena hyaena]|uniref:phospholipase A2 inhibitor and Ly6/PLAUR domain-containing protein n=1 Tax=Hyaena hyaena TaxID=95912 RepID=UPI00192302B8|nr:phospholipase A2 inhibitor and Ly6/PLAUR domain-containing protein [Hyaena hyaena]XP_039102485.1 phospholipase A2 inhibitor and Ly6/PLAUR domain-containing protein [Hyaena hyaena]